MDGMVKEWGEGEKEGRQNVAGLPRANHGA